MSDENEEQFPVDLDMSIVEKQLKQLAPEKFKELETLVQKTSEARKPPDLGSMNEHEFRAYVQKVQRSR